MIKRLAVIFILVFGIASVCGTGRAEEPLVFVGIENSVPYSYDEDGVRKGILYDSIAEIVRRLGIEAKIELVPFNRMLHVLQNGTADATFMIYRNKEREKYLLYSRLPMSESSINVYTRRGKEFAVNDVKDLYNKKVGKQSGFFISAEFDQAARAEKFTVDEAVHGDANLKKLVSDRIDCYVGGLQMSRYYIKRLKLQGQISELTPPIVSGVQTYFALSKAGSRIKNKKAFLKKINETIKALYKDGTFERIQNSYR